MGGDLPQCETSVISFIIPAHNEERFLAATLASIRAAAVSVGESFEVIVVDDESTDGTAGIARAAGATVIPVSLRHIAAVRNAGARAARGDVLVFVDADTLVPPATFTAAFAALQHGATGGGACVQIGASAPPWARHLWAVVNTASRLLGLAAGCFMFVRREAFDAVGGFDERVFFTEEIGLSRALKKRGPIVIVRERVVTSSRKYDEMSFWQFLRQFGPLVAGRSAFSRRHAWWYGPQRQPEEPRPGGTRRL
jgi:glycosyltransferase involved in cell wall biosynthesis